MSDYFLILQAKVLFYFFEPSTLNTHFKNISLKMQCEVFSVSIVLIY